MFFAMKVDAFTQHGIFAAVNLILSLWILFREEFVPETTLFGIRLFFMWTIMSLNTPDIRARLLKEQIDMLNEDQSNLNLVTISDRSVNGYEAMIYILDIIYTGFFVLAVIITPTFWMLPVFLAGWLLKRKTFSLITRGK